MSSYPQVTYLQDSASHKLLVLNASSTIVPPSTVGNGAAYPASWRGPGASFMPRRCALRFTASVALSLTGISVWCYFDSAWSKISLVADLAFVAGDLSRTVVLDFPIGTRIAVAFTASAGAVTVHAFPFETYE